MKTVLSFVLLLGGLTMPAHAQVKEVAHAIFAGGCFWCMEKPFDHTNGVLDVISGFSGGHTENPGYKQVSKGGTGHYEAILVKYDPDVVTYEHLLEVYWPNVDPFDANGQFCDRGHTYKAAIFVQNDAEKAMALASKKAMEEKLGKKIVTEILPAKSFYAAEDYHQDYYTKNPIRYKYYRTRCGRDKRLQSVWGTAASH